MALTDQQAQAAYASGSVAVTAGAGTGKTHMLSERYLHFLRQGISPLQMVAVTFTEKAAAELRSRIRQTIRQQLSDRPDLLAELEAAQISTFHALAARICREHPDKANVPPDFAVQDELDSPIWLAETFAAALEQLPPHLYDRVPFSLMQQVLQALLADPLTAQAALERDRTDWLPRLEEFRQLYIQNIPSNSAWLAAKQELNAYSGPEGDKRELVRQDALNLMSAFEETLDFSYLEKILALNLRGGKKDKWNAIAEFDAIKDAINSLKAKDKGYIPKVFHVLESLEPNEFDDETEAILPTIREGFTSVWNFLQQAKYQQRLLDFNDLEIHALQALADPTVQDYYAHRWTVYLIDEFQDTNPTQGQLLETLTTNATLTIVGDVKQSIYGFRRADVRVFQTWQTRIHPNDRPVELSRSFRTHRSLLTQINHVFAPVLAELHQPLEAHRDEPLDPVPNIQLYTVQVDQTDKDNQAIDTNIDACRRVEAQKIADLVADMLSAPISVHDKPTGELRPIHPGDIAILSQTWKPLELYGSAIAARKIPILQVGGGNLLDTREAKDAWAMLQFLADPVDSLALAAVLRSPFFAISDRILYDFAQSLPDKTSWWKHLKTATDPSLAHASQCLTQLLTARRTEAPSRLLQESDRLTGYTAVIANLPGADRRLADWTGFRELVRSLEGGSFDVLAVVRRLKRIQSAEIKVPRPALAGGDAVNLMTIHASKGLEWPVVIVPDLAKKENSDTSSIRFDPELGIALKLEDDDGERQRSALYTLLEQCQKQNSAEESKRVLYVALTRARDRLVLTSPAPNGGNLDILHPGLDAVVVPTPVAFDPDLASPLPPAAPPLPPYPYPMLVHATGSGFTELPITALNDYALCPKRFEFCHVNGHPGYHDGEGSSTGGMVVGSLAHKALELGIRDVEALKPYAIALTDEQVQDALNCAESFRQSPTFAPYRDGALHWEKPVSLEIQGITFNGYVDLVGQDFVLDFKTDRDVHPDRYQFQLWAYSRALAKPSAHIAYLRHDRPHTFSTDKLKALESQALSLINRLVEGDFTPAPSAAACQICPYAQVCETGWKD